MRTRSWTRGLLAVVAGAWLAAAAGADVIHYRDGRKVEGEIVERTATHIKVKTDFGTVKIAHADIERIEERLTPAQTLAAERAKIPDDDAGSLYQLAQWAGEHGLPKERLALMREVIAADSNHREANEALGRTRVDGVWLDPEELDDYLAAREDEMRAKGLLFHDGKWRPEDEVMRARGFLLLGDEWLPRRDVETHVAVQDLESLVGWSVGATQGKHVTVFTDPDTPFPEEHIHRLDGLVEDFIALLELDEEQRERVTQYDVPIYLLPDFELVPQLLDSEFFDRYPHSDEAHESFYSKNCFGYHWPRPFIALVEGPHLNARGRYDHNRLAFLAHQLVELLVERVKGSRDAPPWLRVGLTAYYDGIVTEEDGPMIISTDGSPPDWARGWRDMWDWRKRLADEDEVAAVDPLRNYFTMPWQNMDSKDVGICWSVTHFLLDRHKAELVEYFRAYDSDPSGTGSGTRSLHEVAWEATFASSWEEIDDDWRSWALAQTLEVEAGLLLR